MDKIVKFRVTETETRIIRQVAARFEGNASLAIRYMIRDYARLNMLEPGNGKDADETRPQAS